MRFLKGIIIILILFGVTTLAYGQVTPTRLDSLQVRHGVKVANGIDAVTVNATTINATNVNVSGVVKTTSGFGINIPSLDDPTYVFGHYVNFATDDFDSIGKVGYGFEYYCDSTNYKPVMVDSNGIVIKAFGIRADNDSGFMRYAFEPVLCDTIGGKETGFFAELALPDSTEYEVYLGLAEKNFAADNRTANGIYFRMLDATRKMIFTTARGGTMDSVTAIANTSFRGFTKFAFKANGSGTVTAYVDGVALTSISKYIPRTSNLTPFIMVKQGAAIVNRQWVYIKNLGFYQYR